MVCKITENISIKQADIAGENKKKRLLFVKTLSGDNLSLLFYNAFKSIITGIVDKFLIGFCCFFQPGINANCFFKVA